MCANTQPTIPIAIPGRKSTLDTVPEVAVLWGLSRGRVNHWKTSVITPITAAA